MAFTLNPISGSFDFYDKAATDALTNELSAETTARIAADALRILSSEKGVADGVATLDSSGKIPASQVPALSLITPSVVTSEAEMLALDAEPGDVAIRTDIKKSYMLAEEPATDLDSWLEIASTPVASVNGRIGNVTGLAEASDMALRLLKSDQGISIDRTSGMFTVQRDLPDQDAAAYVEFKDATTGIPSGYIIGYGDSNTRELDIQTDSNWDNAWGAGINAWRSVANNNWAWSGISAWNTGGSTNLGVAANSTERFLQLFMDGAVRFRVDPTAANYYVPLKVTAPSAVSIPLTVKGAASQSGDLTQWLRSDSTTLGKFMSDGTMQALYMHGVSQANIGAANWGAKLTVNNLGGVASDKLLLLKMAASQTGNILEVQNSAGAVKVSISASDYTVSTTGPIGTAYGAFYGPDAALVGTQSAIAIASVATARAMVFKGAASQSANLTEWQNSAGTVKAAVLADGSIRRGSLTGGDAVVQMGYETSGSGQLLFGQNLNSGFTYLGSAANGGVKVNADSAAGVPFTIQGRASQTANLLEIQNSAGNVVGRFSDYSGGTGFIVRPIGSNPGGIYLADSPNYEYMRSAAGKRLQIEAYNGLDIMAGSGGPAQTTGASTDPTLTVWSQAAANVAQVIKGFASQSANLQEWQNSASAVLAAIKSDGNLYGPDTFTIGPGSGFGGSALVLAGQAVSLQPSNNVNYWNGSQYIFQANGTGTGSVRFFIRGLSGQTGNLQEWQNSAATVLAKIDSVGNVISTSAMRAQWFEKISSADAYIDMTTNNGVGVINRHTVGTVPLYVKGMAGQTGDLQQWQNSASAVLAKIDKDGAGWFGLNSGATNYGVISSGGIYTRGTSDQYQHSNIGLYNNAGDKGWFFSFRNEQATTNADAFEFMVLKPGPLWYSPAMLFPSGKMGFYGLKTAGAALAEPTGTLGVRILTSGEVGFSIHGASSQSADLQQWQNNSGTVVAKVNAIGDLYAQPTVDGGTVFTYYVQNRQSQGPYLAFTTSSLTSYPRSASNVGFTVKGEPSQSADLQQWKNSSDTVVAAVSNTGSAGFLGGVTVNYSGANGATAAFTSTSGNSYMGVNNNNGSWISGSLVGDMFFRNDVANRGWLFGNSAGTLLAKIDSTGSITGANIYGTSQVKAAFELVAGSSANAGTIGALTVYPWATSVVGLAVRAFTGQTADLFQVRDSSSTVLAKVPADGSMRAQWFEAMSGGSYMMAASANPNSLLIPGGGVSSVGLAIKGQAGQTGDLQQWKNSSNTLLTAVTKDGWVGIGGTPASQLHLIDEAGAATRGFINQENVTGANAALSIFRRSRNNASSPTALVDGDYIGSFVFQPYQGGYIDSTASFGAKVNGTVSSGNVPTELFFTTSGGAADNNPYGNGTVRMVISPAGYVGIGTTAPATLGSGSVPTKLGIVANAATTVGQVVRGFASQSANLTEWQNSAGTVLAKVDSVGNLLFNAAADLAYTGPYLQFLSTKTLINARTSTNIGLVVQGAASQTANLQEWQNSAGTILTRITSDGTLSTLGDVVVTADRAIYIGGVNGRLIHNNKTVFAPYFNGGYNTAIYSGNDDSAPKMQILAAGTLLVNGFTAATVGQIIKGAASQSANLQEWQNSAGSQLAVMTSNGRLGANAGVYGGSSDVAYPSVFAEATAATAIPLVAKGWTSQSANLTEWRNSANGVLAFVNSSGEISAARVTTAGYMQADNFYGNTSVWARVGSVDQVRIGGLSGAGAITFGSAEDSWITRATSGGLRVSQSAAVGQVVLAVRGMASQTGNLQEWQNSASTILWRINANGVLAAEATQTGGALIDSISGSALFANGSPNNKFINAHSASDVVVMVKGFASQSANLTEWQNSAGTVIANVDASGRGYFAGVTSTVTSVFSGASGVNTGFLMDLAQTGPFARLTASAFSVEARTATNVGFIVKGAASQSANLQEWQTSAGALKASINAGGQLNVQAADNPSIIAIAGAANYVPLVARGTTSQTGDLQQWQNNAGTVLASVGSDGSITFGGTGTPTAKWLQTSNYGYQIGPSVNLVEGLALGVQVGTGVDIAPVSYGSRNIRFYSGLAQGLVFRTSVQIGNEQTASHVALVVKGAASQSGDLTQWQNSAGTVLAKVVSDGFVTASNFALMSTSNYYADSTIASFMLRASASPNTMLRPGAANHVPLVIKGFASQSANLTEWQDSAGSVLAAVTANGSVLTPYLANSTITGPFFTMSASGTTLTNQTTVGNTVFTVKGMAGQTGDLQQWMNSSGTVLTSINSGGFVTAPAYYSASQVSYALWGGSPNTLLVATGSANIPFVIKGAASQSANLTEWQNSSGTVLAALQANGTLTAKYLQSSLSAGAPYFDLQASNTAITLLTNGVANIGLIVKGSASQTADLFQAQKSSGFPVFTIDANGVTAIAPAGSSATRSLYVQPPAANQYALVVRGLASQTGALQTWEDDPANILARVQANGVFGAFALSAYSNAAGAVAGSVTAGTHIIRRNGDGVNAWQFYSNDGDTQLYLRDLVNARMHVQYVPSATASYTLFGGMVQANGQSASSSALVAKGAASQTADIFQVRDSADVVKARFDPTGSLGIGTTTLGSINSFGTVLAVEASGNVRSIRPGVPSQYAELIGLASSGPALHSYGGNKTLSIINESSGVVTSTVGTHFYQGQTGSITWMGGFDYQNHFQLGPYTGPWTSGTNTFLSVNAPSTVDNLASAHLTAGASTHKTLVIQGFASQSANLTEWQNSAGTVLAQITSAGRLAINGVIGGMLDVTASAAGVTPLVLKGAASQSAELALFQNSAGTNLGKILSDGRPVFSTYLLDGTNSYPRFARTSDDALIQTNSGSYIYLSDVGGLGVNMNSGLTASGLAVSGLHTYDVVTRFRGVALQSANMTQWENSAGTALASVDYAGTFRNTSNSYGYHYNDSGSTTARLSIFSDATSTVVSIFRGIASQTANLTEWQTSGGSVLSYIKAGGSYVNQSGAPIETLYLSAVANTGAILVMNPGGGSMLQNRTNAANVAFTIQGAASQSGDLTQWQNSASTVLAKVNSLGQLTAAILARIGTTASSATPTPDADASDQYNVTALAADATFGAPTGTPTDGQRIVIRIKDNGTARALAWNAIYRALGITIPTTTVANKTLYVGTRYNAADSKWDVISVAQEA